MERMKWFTHTHKSTQWTKSRKKKNVVAYWYSFNVRMRFKPQLRGLCTHKYRSHENEYAQKNWLKHRRCSFSHHSWSAAYSSAHKSAKQACCTYEIEAMQCTAVKHTYRHSHTFIFSGACLFPCLGLWIQCGIFKAKCIAFPVFWVLMLVCQCLVLCTPSVCVCLLWA